MITNSVVKRVGGTNSDQCAAKIQPILLIPPQGRCEIELRIFQRGVNQGIRAMTDEGKDADDHPS
jgi:hypothetical protein